MILLTGGCGFIGSNFARTCTEKLIIVDNLSHGLKIQNITGVNVIDFYHFESYAEIEKLIRSNKITSIVHLGAISSTNELDGNKLIVQNYNFSKWICQIACDLNIKFIYASSASVYGTNNTFQESLVNEAPINPYAFSKFLFDQFVRENYPSKKNIIGLRLFNIYGNNEMHKLQMMSPVSRFIKNLKNNEKIRIFKSIHGAYDDYQRDFTYVADVISIINHFIKNNSRIDERIYNVGSGVATGFREIAEILCSYLDKDPSKFIEYINFPDELRLIYQPYTRADLGLLRLAGYTDSFYSIEDGIRNILNIKK